MKYWNGNVYRNKNARGDFQLGSVEYYAAGSWKAEALGSRWMTGSEAEARALVEETADGLEFKLRDLHTEVSN